MKNHLGTYECKLCLTLHTNEGSYLAHTQGKKHQTNLARRAAKLAKEKTVQPVDIKRTIIKKVIKIGRPGYKVSITTAPQRSSPVAPLPAHLLLFSSSSSLLLPRSCDGQMIGMTYLRSFALSGLRITNLY